MKLKQNKTVIDIIKEDVDLLPNAAAKGLFPKFDKIDNQKIAKFNFNSLKKKNKSKKIIKKILNEDAYPGAASKGLFPKYSETTD